MRLALSVALFLLFVMSQAALGAEEETAPFVLKVESGTVDVFRPDGSLLQSLPYAGDGRDAGNREYFTSVVDMDFDGFPDVGVLSSRGVQNAFYDCWLWREGADSFVKNEELGDISSPGFDAERKRVTSFAHDSATDNVTSEYAWEDGRLVLMEQIVQEYSPERDEFTISHNQRGDDGEMRLVEGKTVASYEMEALLNGDREVAVVPFINNLGFDIEAVYAHNPKYEKPVKIAGPLADGRTAEVDTSAIHEMSSWLYVKRANDENAEAPLLQFHSGLSLDEVERMELTLGDVRKVPVLLTAQGVLDDAAIAGFPFNSLLSHLESETGLEAGTYADLMMPMEADGWEEYPCALVSNGLSWSLLAPGPVFREEEDGEKRLSSVAFSAAASRGEFAAFVKELERYGITSREHGGERVFFESPYAFYEVLFDPETDIVELSYLRKSDTEHEDVEESGDADALSLFDDVMGKIRDREGSTYALHDIDGDGMKELFVGSTDGSGEYTVHSYANGETHDLGLFWPRRRLLLGENGALFISGSSGAARNSIEKARISFDGKRLEILETWEMNEDVYTHSTTETVPESVWDTADERSSGASDAADSLNWLPLP
jgi:hypothetical protein